MPSWRRLPFSPLSYNQSVAFAFVSRLKAFGGLSPGSARVTTTGRASFTTAHGMVDRVHGDAPDPRTFSKPSFPAGFAQGLVFMFNIFFIKYTDRS